MTATGNVGSVDNALTAFLTGVSATGQVGSFTVSFWSVIDDRETANWQNINSSESAGWTEINDAEDASWELIGA